MVEFLDVSGAHNNNDPADEEDISTKSVKRARWATQRVKSTKGDAKRKSILGRLNRATSKRVSSGSTGKEKRHSDGTHTTDGVPDKVEESEEQEVGDAQPRTIYVNQPLPDEAKDEEGKPLQHFRRNKIRTAKYTPLSFIPKNLYYQFQNIANLYFLFLIILAFFDIFGAANPGLNAVPLIVIVVVTAIKDAIEDWRRTMLDNELNNSPVHRLVDWENVNAAGDEIGPWRRFKKACSHAIANAWRSMNKKKLEKGEESAAKVYAERALGGRPSMATRRSIDSHRDSLAVPRSNGDVELTPVSSPVPPAQEEDGDSIGLAVSPKPESQALVKNKGNVINPLKQSSGKARFVKDYWKNVQVGDFIRIYNDDQIPADVVVMSTSEADGGCYVETKNLDGETNLKVRQSLNCGRMIKHARDCERTDFRIESEPPHANLYSYSGAAKWVQRNPKTPSAPGTDMAEPIGINNLLLRGCNLRNTEWVLAMVVFTGEETKIMLNAGITPSKRSRIARELNWNVIYNFVILIVMCLVSGIVNGVAWGRQDASLSFFEYGSIGGTPGITGFITFWTNLILFQNLVPISLYISLEIIKTAQAFFIYSDVEMYYQRLDYPCTPKSWNISDDLGQIEYIFSDKTGTLTQNVMEFKKCSINGVPYGEAYTEALAGMQKRQGIDTEVEGAKARKQIAIDKIKMLADLRDIHNNPYLVDDELTFVAPDFVNDLTGASGKEQKEANAHFMLALALCHTVITERTPGNPPRIEFKAQSPDEAALVATAKDCGFTFIGSQQDMMLLNCLGEEREYEVLNILEFNSSRKRMSAIIRMPDGSIKLFCKGADSIIYGRLKRGLQSELRQTTAEHLELFAREGLRTLCIAERDLTESEYAKWNEEHKIAAAAVENREDKLEEVSDKIERELMLVGGTAIEDRLQDGVPDTIALLGDAGIKLWVLTGDKVETAINIGFSCNLLGNDMELINIKPGDNTVEAAEKELDRYLQVFGKTGSDEELKRAMKDHTAPPPGHALIIDGDALKLVLNDAVKQKFLLLCKECKAVLCCRVSPAQKASVVAMVKRGLDVMTLSIGDGANDVAMIQEADIGVGIAGEEGRQAVMSSDYAIGQFRFLKRLVLVHGRWSYRRLAETIANFFYKNMVWTFTLFWYQIYQDFDGAYLFDYTYILLYNLAFTSLPIIFMGILDQDVSDRVSLAVPQLYRRGIERKEWTQTKFWIHMADGIFQSVISFWMIYLLFDSVFVTHQGNNINDRERIGVYVAFIVVIVNNLYILMNTYRWDWLMGLLVAISILLIFAWTGIYTQFTASTQTLYYAAEEIFGQVTFWASVVLVSAMCLLPRFICKCIQKVYFPYDVDIVREWVQQGKFKHLEVENDPEGEEERSNESSSSSGISALKHANTNENGNGTTEPRIEIDRYDESRPMYPPSITATTTTAGQHKSQNGSDGTEYTNHASERRVSLGPSPLDNRLSGERPRPSFDRLRSSMDVMRPSFEESGHITTAASLVRADSGDQNPTLRSFDYSRRGPNTLR